MCDCNQTATILRAKSALSNYAAKSAAQRGRSIARGGQMGALAIVASSTRKSRARGEKKQPFSLNLNPTLKTKGDVTMRGSRRD